jgi:hypothetical protein
MDWANPVEWFAWIYGKLFQNHFYVGAFTVMVVFSVFGLVLWIRGVDRYKEDHPTTTEAADKGPKQQTVTATASNPASQNVTVQNASTQGVQGTTSAQPAATEKKTRESVKRSKRPPERSSVYIVNNEGTLTHSDVKHARIEGTIPANKDVGILHVAPGAKADGLHIDDAFMALLPENPIIPAPSLIVHSNLTYKEQVRHLLHDITVWEQQNADAQSDHWEPATREFHEKFGSQVVQIAEELRNCGYSVVKQLYSREQMKAEHWGIIEHMKLDLQDLAEQLPADDAQLHCGN